MSLSKGVVAPLAFTVALIAGDPARAQQASLGPGQRVRVTTQVEEALRTHRSTIIGNYAGRVEDKLLVAREHAAVGATPDTVPLFLVQQIEVSKGMRSRARLVATGFAVGSAVSLGAYLMIHLLPALCGPSQPDPCPPGQKRVRGFGDDRIYAIPIALGVIHGALAPREKWARVTTPSLSVGPSGIRGVTITFRVAAR